MTDKVKINLFLSLSFVWWEDLDLQASMPKFVRLPRNVHMSYAEGNPGFLPAFISVEALHEAMGPGAEFTMVQVEIPKSKLEKLKAQYADCEE